MPTYEYACKSCSRTFEVVQGMKDAALTTCAECGGELRKVFFPAGIMFKGSGFYATDNRKGAKGSTKAGETGGSSSEGKPDVKEKATAGSGSGSGSEASSSSDSDSGSGSGSGSETKTEPKKAKKNDSSKPATSGSGAGAKKGSSS